MRKHTLGLWLARTVNVIRVTKRLVKSGLEPVIMTPQAAPFAFTVKGTL